MTGYCQQAPDDGYEWFIPKEDVVRLGGDALASPNFGSPGDGEYSVPDARIPADLHLEITKPDDRGRFRLGRHISKDPAIAGWKVYVADGGRTVRLVAVDGAQ